MRLIDHLKQDLGLSNRQAQAALRSGKVRLRGVPTADAAREIEPAEVHYEPTAPRILVGSDPAVVFADAHLAVIWKPAGLLSVPAPRRGGEPDLVGRLRRVLGQTLPVHRLDEETSGLMLVARTPEAQGAIKELLFRHQLERRYLALAMGRLAREPVTVRAPIENKPATTHLRLIEPLGSAASLVEASLETGRTHQIRIHLASIRHPIIGDTRYGARAAFSRIALHAAVLGFRHPVTGADMRFEAPLADDLEQLRRNLLGQRRRS